MNPIKEPCKREEEENNKLNIISLKKASKEIPKMIKQSKKVKNEQ